MPRPVHVTKYLLISFALHALILVSALFLISPSQTEKPPFTPVKLVDLPRQTLKKLPPLRTPALAPAPAPRRSAPERPLPPGAVPMPKKFGESEELSLPKTSPPSGRPGGPNQGKEPGKTAPLQPHKQTGPLPFLTQNDIDELARRGMPEKKAGDDSVTLDTDEFKFISYNRWLKIKIESVLRYPELAAVSGYQGTLYIKFDIMKDGALGGLEILKSSGFKILDDEALRAIRTASPFQPLPEDWHMERYSIRAAVLFYLSEVYLR